MVVLKRDCASFHTISEENSDKKKKKNLIR